jgi:hypothetical protein
MKKNKKMKGTIIIRMMFAVAVTRAIMIEEDAEESEDVAAEDAATIVII